MRVTLTRQAGQAMFRRKISKGFANSIWYVVVIGLSVMMLFPLLWMITIALKGNNDIFQIPPAFWPKEYHWENFVKGVQAIDFGRLFYNSAVITLLSTIGSVASSTL